MIADILFLTMLCLFASLALFIMQLVLAREISKLSVHVEQLGKTWTEIPSAEIADETSDPADYWKNGHQEGKS